MKRTQYVLYAVTLREHPGILKLGRTTKWSSRRREYDNWNFASGDGVEDCAVYIITEEYADLAALEKACLDGLATVRPIHRGNEWFKASFADGKAVIEDVLNTCGMTYVEAGGAKK